MLTEDTDSFIIGDRVWVGGTKPGQIAYIGETQFAPGEWAGVVLDEPVGKFLKDSDTYLICLAFTFQGKWRETLSTLLNSCNKSESYLISFRNCITIDSC